MNPNNFGNRLTVPLVPPLGLHVPLLSNILSAIMFCSAHISQRAVLRVVFIINMKRKVMIPITIIEL